MKKTNRIIALAMAAMTALSMTACSGSAKETTEAESAAETTAEAAEESSAEETKEASGETLLMATTTSTDNTGLLDYLKPIFLEDTGIDLQWTAVGTGDAIQKAKDGEVDVILVHSKAKEEEFWNNIEVGKKYTGTVTAISDYGAFVDIGGAQGLLHISEMTWGRNQNPRDILEVGQSIEVSVKELDKENKRFKLSYEKKGPNPWNKVEEKYHVGDVVKVKISKIMPFGAFAELEKGIEGLIHISQICERKIAKPEEELQVGQKVNAKIINIDFENKKIELSIRELEGTSQEYKENA